MAGVSGNLSLSVVASLIGAPVGGAEPVLPVNVNRSRKWGPGTDGIDKANILYHAERTLAGGATDSLDLAGVLADAFGGTIAAAEIVAIILQAHEDNVAAVRMGPAAASGFLGPWADATDRENVLPGDFSAKSCRTGWAVTAGSLDTLAVINASGGTQAKYTLSIVGRTVAA